MRVIPKGRYAMTVVVVLVLSATLSGCVSWKPASDDPTTPEPESPMEPFRQSGAFFLPVLINRTDQDHVVFDYTIQDDCPFSPIQHMGIAVYYKHGLVSEQTYPIAGRPGESYNLTILLEGDAPFIVTGSLHACVAVWDSHLVGVGEAVQLSSRTTGWSRADTAAMNQIDFTVPAGATLREISYEHLPRAYQMDVLYVHVDPPSSSMGEIRTYYPTGELGRRDWWSPLHNPDAEFAPPVWLPGQMKTVVELSAPLREDLPITIVSRNFVVDEQMCIYGFEWDLCSEAQNP